MNNIYIKKIGSGSQSLVMLHGWGFNHTIWLEWCKILGKDFTCYLVDLPGYGLTPFMSDAEWFALLHAEISQPFHLLGWSLGGLYAIRYAELFPNDVISLYLIASSPFFIRDQEWPGIEYNAFRQFQQQLITNPQQTLDSFINIHSKGSIPKSWQYIPPDLRALNTGVESLITWDLRKNLKSLPHKIYLTLGRLDKIIPVELAESIKHYYPAISINVLPKTGHMPFLTPSGSGLEFGICLNFDQMPNSRPDPEGEGGG